MDIVQETVVQEPEELQECAFHTSDSFVSEQPPPRGSASSSVQRHVLRSESRIVRYGKEEGKHSQQVGETLNLTRSITMCG